MDSFTWKNLDSYLDFGIIITQKPPLSKAERNVEEIEVPGRDGDLTVDLKTFKPITFPLVCNMRFSTHTIDEVKAWLDGFEKLSFSWDNDKYYKARMINRIDIAQSLQTFGEFPLLFKAQPHAYAFYNPIITLTSNNSTFYNAGVESKPIFKIYGTGNIDLNVNGNIIHLTNILGYLTIDSELMDCYKDTLLQNNSMNGDFPTLIPTINSVSWTGTVTKIEITPNWRYL